MECLPITASFGLPRPRSGSSPSTLSVGCLPLPFEIAKSSGATNYFSAIKCKKEKVCINLRKVTDWAYVFKLFWTSPQIISICAQSFCDIIPQCSKIN